MRTLLRVLGLLTRYRAQLALTYGCLLATIGLNLYVPQLIQQVIDKGLAMADRQALLAVGTIILVVALARSVFGFGRMYLTEWLANRLAFDLRNLLYEKYQRLSFAFHDKAHTGDLMARATSDIDAVVRFAGNGLLDLANILLLFIGTFIVMAASSSWLTLIAMAPAPVLLWVTFRFANRQRRLSKQAQDQMGRVSTTLQENLTGARVVKAFAREEHERFKFRRENTAYLQSRLAVVRSWASNFPLMNVLVSVSVSLVLWFGGQMVIAGMMSIGSLFAFTSYVLMLGMPVQRLGFLVNMVSAAAASGDRLYEMLDLTPRIADKPGAVPLGEVSGAVLFEDVSFGYADEEVLHNVSFEAQPNQVVALLGPTGAGKSTIVNLLPRFYDVTGGRITIDGRDIRDVTVESLRRRIGIVLQETFLFSTTVLQNIAYFDRKADFAAVTAAAKAARAHDFIMALPDGYETRVGERGITLSGGQRQRIAIARALLMNPRVLVLDDSLSAVDTETEYLIQQALTELMKGRTTIVIAQRLVTLKAADLILVLDRGRIIQRGTHDQLVSVDGLYRRIYDLQLKAQESIAAEAGWAAAVLAEGR